MKTWIAAALTLASFTVACTNETTMVRRTVSPHDTALRDPSARVVAIEHVDGTRAKPSKRVAPDDRIVVDVPGSAADLDRGEHLVHYRQSTPMVIAGASMMGFGGVVASFAAGCRESSSSSNPFGSIGMCIAPVVTLGASFLIPGIALIVSGLRPHAYQKKIELPRVQFAPTFEAHGGGGVLSLTF